MKILLIDVIDEKDSFQVKYYSLGLAYLAGYLKSHIKEKLEIKIIKTNLEMEIKSFCPEIVGLSSVSQNFNKAKKIAEFCKSQGIFVIVGKSHISAIPSCLDKNMDVGVIGEGEETFKEIVELFIGKKIDKDNLGKIKGIVFRSDGKIAKTPPRQVIKDLDSLPIPDRKLLNLKRRDEIYLFSSRGCPYRCNFCFSSRFWDTVRFFSAEYVLRELRYLVEQYDPPRINFYDDLFIANRKRLKEIVTLIKKEKFHKKVKFTVSVRANLVDDESARLLKEMGADIINMGLESGNERVLTFLKEGSVTVEDNKNAIKHLKKYGLQVSASFIIGSPDETRTEILDTLDFIKKSKLDLFDVYVLTPLPGTPIWESSLKKGLVSNTMDWKKLDVDFSSNTDEAIILSEKLSRNEIKELFQLFIKERNKRYYKLLIKSILTRPNEVLLILKNKVLPS